MPGRFSSDEEINEFLSEPRLAILMTNRQSHAPIGVPVWFEWADSNINIFAQKSSAKLKRIAGDTFVRLHMKPLRIRSGQ